MENLLAGVNLTPLRNTLDCAAVILPDADGCSKTAWEWRDSARGLISDERGRQAFASAFASAEAWGVGVASACVWGLAAWIVWAV